MTRFTEVQRFRSNPIAMAVLVLSAFLVVGAGFAAPAHVRVLPVIIFGLVGTMLFFGRLDTEVREDGLYVRMFPLREKKIRYDEITLCQACTYRPIMEYGGWGIRFSKHGRALNVHGDRGVQLEMTGGKRLLIGSQRPEALEAAILEMLR